ncbi:MAG TPA: hypothetical protein VF345_00960 [Chthoniobacterales bacterium]
MRVESYILILLSQAFMRSALCRFVVAIACYLVATDARGQIVRVTVAIVDGSPAYHWPIFDPIYSKSIRDDVDRALIVREFQRRGYTLPEHFVDEALNREVAQHYGGDKEKLIQALKQKGATAADFRQFLAEDIIVQAFLVRVTRRATDGRRPQSKAEWLAGLSKRARIEMVK